VRLSRTAPRPALLLVAAALAISTGWASVAPFRAAIAGTPVYHRIGSHFAHVPQALAPRSFADDRKELRQGPPPATAAASATESALLPVTTSHPATVAGPAAVAAARPQPRAPPGPAEV
jgi:hypothetical protein